MRSLIGGRQTEVLWCQSNQWLCGREEGVCYLIVGWRNETDVRAQLALCVVSNCANLITRQHKRTCSYDRAYDRDAKRKSVVTISLRSTCKNAASERHGFTPFAFA
jgi:hypothetical protein